jgi:hypothetical protein
MDGPNSTTRPKGITVLKHVFFNPINKGKTPGEGTKEEYL